jgi:SAM-dependent methyltransferase
VLREERFSSARASEAYLEWRFENYPLCRELCRLWGNHTGQVVLDYGCGPGHDTTGLLLHSGARRVVAMDVSIKALRLTAHRLSLHRIDPTRVELIQVLDGDPSIPLDDNSVEHINCGGVLHHVSNPGAVLAELVRVLKPGGMAVVMVYNRDSVFFHLVMAYWRMVVQGEWSNLDPDAAFTRMTDGPDCPISIAYRPPDWLELSRCAGFDPEYAGGYLSVLELEAVEKQGLRAIADDRLAAEHRDFLLGLRWDDGSAFPKYEGRYAGVGGTYYLRKPM